MAQPQSQYQASPQPSQTSPSPANSTTQFPLPPAKRQKMSPGPPSQPGSPFPPQSPYAMSPGASTPGTTTASPQFNNNHVQIPQGLYTPTYSTPYAATNGQSAPTLNLPQSNGQPYQPPYFPSANQNQSNPNYMIQSPGPGTMGPPLKPAEKPKEIDPTDLLGGTGIDLLEEEQYTWQLTKSFNSQMSGSQSGTISSGNSFTQFPPGDEKSFYGAGPANTGAEIPNIESQNDYHRKVVDTAWNQAAHDLAISRQKELGNPFLTITLVARKMDKIALENGLSLRKEGNGAMGTMKLPYDFPQPTVHVQTAIGPNGAITATSGTFVPLDSLLVDHVALLSIATKHRLRGLIEDAARLAKGRQTGSHGVVPEEWKDVAVPARVMGGSDVPGSGGESAVSSNALKRPLSAANRFPTPVSDGTKTPTANPNKFTNEVAGALRAQAFKEREFEEKRLRKRKDREQQGMVPAASRASSITPGTPGSVAPEPMEKAPSKKEQKKNAQAKQNDAANHVAANQTTSKFIGGGGKAFGKKKYSWLTGGSGSGTSTPAKLMTQNLSEAPSGLVEPVVEQRLTSDGVRRLGAWREDKDKGVGIQVRDWIAVLEQDGREKQALQRVYATLDDQQLNRDRMRELL